MSDQQGRGRGRPPIDESGPTPATPVRLGESLTAAADARAAADGVPRAELVRRAVHAYVDPAGGALVAGAPWQRTARGGPPWYMPEWMGRFDYLDEWGDVMPTDEDWRMSLVRPSYHTYVNFGREVGGDYGPLAPGDPVRIELGLKGDNSHTLSIESAEALGRSVLAAVALARLGGNEVVPALTEALTGVKIADETDPLPEKLPGVIGDPAKVAEALRTLQPGST